MSKGLINIIIFIAACVALFYISQNLINEKKVPSFGNILASSTSEFASSTEATSSLIPELASTTVDQNNLVTSSTTEVSTSTSASVALSNILSLKSTTLYTTKGSLKVFIADTDAVREQGLSDITSLPKGEGMLFTFDTSGQYGFWMKNMNFPLDLVWIDSNYVVANVTKDATPDSYPSVFMPVRSIQYVVEVNAGTADKFGLIKGSSVKFSI